jgi:hypothetical protein
VNLPAVSTTELAIFIGVAVLLLAGVAIWLFTRKRRTERLRNRFGGAEYDRSLQEGGSKRTAEAGLDKRADRVESFHIQPLGVDDRVRFLKSWREVQMRFVDGPGAAVTEADQLLGEVMSKRGYPVSDFEQRAADISVDHPLVLENYRAGHRIAVLQTSGQASTEDLRQAMIHYRTLFDELVGEPEMARAKAAS